MNSVTLTPIFKVWSDALDSALQGTAFVVSGCAPTAGAGLAVAIASGSYFDTSIKRTYAGGTVTPGAAHATLPRRDLVYFPAGGGAPLVAAGTAAATPLPPAIPVNACAVAICFIPANATDYSAGFPGSGIEDIRMIQPDTLPATLGANGTFLNISGGAVRWGNTIDTGGLTITAGAITMGAGASQLVPGVTSFSVRDNANANDNLLVANSGNVSVRGALTVTGGSITTGADNAYDLAAVGTRLRAAYIVTVTATTLAGTLSTAAQGNVTSLGTLTSLTTSGAITMTAAASQLIPGATTFSLRNNANNADNLIILDAGGATFRSTVSATQINSTSSSASLPSFGVSSGNGIYNVAANSVGITISSAETVRFNASGMIQTTSGFESTGAGTALLSTNCPAVTVSAPYKWIKMVTSDASVVYFPVWK